MENLTINQGIKFTAGDGTGVIGTANPSGSQGISKTAGHTGFYIQSSVDYTLYFYDGSSWSAHQSIDVSDANYVGGFAFAWEDNTAAYIKTADSSHVVYVFARNTDLKVDSTPSDGTQAADSIVDGTGSLSITSINAQNYYTEALSVANDGTVTFDRTDNNNAYQLKFSGNNITIGSNGSDTITLTGGDEFTSPLTTDGDLFIQSGSADARLGIGSDGQYLSVSSGAPAWVDLSASPWSTYTSPDDYVEFTAGGVSIGGSNTYTAGGQPYRDGVLVVGKTNTLNNIQRGLIVGYGNQMGVNNYASSSSVFGISNIMYEGSANMASGASNRIGYGNYNQAFGYNNQLYGNKNSALGEYLYAGTTSANVDNTVLIGKDMKANADNQILIGQGIDTNASWASEPGIYIGFGGARANAGFFRDPGAATTSPVNFVLGGISAMRSDASGMVKTGAGSGMFYLHNEPSDIRIVEPSTDLSHGIAMWAKNRTSSNQLGLIVKAENGGMSWIGDRIGVNVTSTGDANAALSSTIDASLHVFGEGSTSATSSFKVDNSAGTTLFEVKDDGTVQANGGGLLGLSNGSLLEINTGAANTLGGTFTQGGLIVGDNHTLSGGGRRFLVSGHGNNAGSNYLNGSNMIGLQNYYVGGQFSTAIGAANRLNAGNYGFAAGYSNQIWGDNSIALGIYSQVGSASADADNSVAIGNVAKAVVSNQIVIGKNVTTNASYSAKEGIYFGWGSGRPTAGMIIGDTNQAFNFIIGGTNSVRTDLNTIVTGMGEGIFYLNNYTDSNIIQPTANAADSVGMWAKSRAAGVTGLIVKAENGNQSWIGDRIGINISGATGTNSTLVNPIDASLHIYGEGNSNATSAVKVENSDGNVAIEVLNDLVVVMPNLPTSSAGLPTGALYNDGGVLKIA